MPSDLVRTQKMLDIIREHYGKDLSQVFQTTIALTGAKPEQANNEIRNGLNHLARALAEGDAAGAESQFRKAIDHFDRAKRDCLKISIVQLFEDLWAAIKAVEIVDGSIDSDLRREMRTWQHERHSITRAECRGEANIGERLMKLVNDGVDLKKKLINRHRTPPVWRVWLHRQRPRVISAMRDAVSVVAWAFVAGVMLYAYHTYEQTHAKTTPTSPSGIPSQEADTK